MLISPEHIALPRSPDEGDEQNFCRCLARIDRLFQQDYLQRVGAPPAGLQDIFLAGADVASWLDDPAENPAWLEQQRAYLPDSAKALTSRLQGLITTFDLNSCERDLLLVTLLPRLFPPYAALPGSNMQDGVERSLLTQLLALTQTEYRLLQSALHPSSPLFRYHLLSEIQPVGKRAASAVAVSESLWQYFCGIEMLVSLQQSQVRRVMPDESNWYPQPLGEQLFRLCLRANAEPLPVVVLEGYEQDGREQALAAIVSEYGHVMLCINIDALATLPEAQQFRLITETVRDALLYNAVLVLENSAVWGSIEKRGYVWALEQLLKPVRLPLIILANVDAEVPAFSELACVHIAMPVVTNKVKAHMLQLAWPSGPDVNAQPELYALAQRYTFQPADLPLLFREADHYCQIRGEHAELTPEDLRQALSRRSRKNFGKLAQRITPVRTFDDLILSPALRTQMAEIMAAIRLQESITDKHFNDMPGGKMGISALFYGDSGTGKTLAAEVLAQHLKVDLIKVDLSTVVNKYIGETEKNLARIFDLAQEDSGVLFFDEADALFGKRSETKDAHDRHANIEVSYLLQRLESYPGLVILATNNRNHLDSAFNRRFTFIARFLYPDASLREQMWRAIWPSTLTPASDIDFGALARTELTGANIRNVIQLAAVLAAKDESETIRLVHIEHAVGRELGKLGRVNL